jgi:hypothetical protein
MRKRQIGDNKFVLHPNLILKLVQRFGREYLTELTDFLSHRTTWNHTFELVELQNSQNKTPARAGPDTTGYQGSVRWFCVCDAKAQARLGQQVTPNGSLLLQFSHPHQPRRRRRLLMFFWRHPTTGTLSGSCLCMSARAPWASYTSSQVIIIIQLHTIPPPPLFLEPPGLSDQENMPAQAQRHPRGPQSSSEDDCEEADHT